MKDDIDKLNLPDEALYAPFYLTALLDISRGLSQLLHAYAEFQRLYPE